MFKHYRILCAISILLLAACACALPLQTAAPTPTPVPPTLAPSDTPIPDTDTPAPTDTPADTETPTVAGPTDTATLPVGVLPSDTPTPTLEPVFANAIKTAACRTGPAGNYALVTTFQLGAKMQVLARDLGGGYIFVQDPANPDKQCYVPLTSIQLFIDPTALPQLTAIASPTASMNINADFRNYDYCHGNAYAVFKVDNIGGVSFTSANVKVTDLKTGETTTWEVDAFDQWQGCVIAKNVPTLDPGQSFYLRSNTFNKTPQGTDKMKATIQACSEPSLQGTCINITISWP